MRQTRSCNPSGCDDYSQCVGRIECGAEEDEEVEEEYASGTITETNGLEYGDYIVYAVTGSTDSWVMLSVRDKDGNEIDSITINQGETGITETSNLAITVVKVAALSDDKTIVGVDITVADAENIEAMDTVSPTISNIEIYPDEPTPKDEITITATCTDEDSLIKKGELKIDGGMYQLMEAADGEYDEKREEVELNIGVLEGGTHTLQINCTDTSDNWRESEVIEFEVIYEGLNIPVAPNTKDSSKYKDRTVFLVSDKNWRDILSLVPVAIWTNDDGSVSKHPLLIYHEEESGFDADSIIYFMQQYAPINKLFVVGKTPQELDNLLITKPELGAGLTENKITRIYPSEYLSYWSSAESVVVVDYDNYETGLMASTFASYINAPILFIASGNLEEYGDLMNNREVHIVEQVDTDVFYYAEQHSKEVKTYSLEELQEEYVKLTKTDKIILVNPNDLNIDILGVELVEKYGFVPEGSSQPIFELYNKESLAAPFLAAAKHEVIITTKNKDAVSVDKTIENKAKEFNIEKGYLTIIGTPDSVTSDACEERNLAEGTNFACFADLVLYSHLNGDYIPDLIPGRIFGITISDVSSYIARATFYSSLTKSNDIINLAGDFSDSISRALAYQKTFEDFGYVADEIINYEECCPLPISENYKDKFLIFYEDHGSHNWLGLHSSRMPQLTNTFIIGQACSTCIYNDFKSPDLFCMQALRKGAIGYYGMFEGGGVPSTENLLSSLFTNQPIGRAYLAASSNFIVRANSRLNKREGDSWSFLNEGFGFIGDPTLSLDPAFEFPYSEVKKLSEDEFSINFRVTNIPVDFSHIGSMNGGDVQINVNEPYPVIFSSTEKNNLFVYNLWISEYLEREFDISSRFSFGVRVESPQGKIYKTATGSFESYPEMSYQNDHIIEETEGDKTYLWIFFNLKHVEISELLPEGEEMLKFKFKLLEESI